MAATPSCRCATRRVRQPDAIVSWRAVAVEQDDHRTVASTVTVAAPRDPNRESAQGLPAHAASQILGVAVVREERLGMGRLEVVAPPLYVPRR